MLYEPLQVLTVMLAAFTAVFALAHAFELPGKKRLDRDAYLIVQRIYYPGFTIGGFAEIASQIVALVLLLLTPVGTPAFWLVLAGFLGLVVAHAIYWIVTHPVNKVWLQDETLGEASAGFFAFASDDRRGAATMDWTVLRDRWEYSHVARAILARLSLLALVVSLVVQ
jgi:hypothetical protein